MKKYKLGEIAKEVSSGATPSRNKLTYWENGNIPWLKTEQIGQYRIKNTNEHISQQAVKETALKLYPKNTISIAMYGEGRTRGNVSITDCELTTNQACCNIVVDNDIVEPFYLYYFLKTQYQNFRNLSSGIRKNLNTNIIKNYDIYLPSKEKQIKVSNFLKSIDDKIAINNQINELLERVAKAIYEYYFVQFDFPNKQGQPYKSSGGAMRFDPTLNRPIPKDFEVKKLADIIIKNTKKAEKDNKKSLIDLSVMPQNTFCLNLNNIGDAFNTNLFEMQKFDILFGSIRPYLKKAGFAPFDGLVTGTIHSVKPINPNFFNFILLTLTHKSFFDYAVSVSKGTKMPIIGYEELSDFKIPFNESIIEKFNTILNFKEIISNNIIQNQKLKNLRDFLLPLLINAQVQI